MTPAHPLGAFAGGPHLASQLVLVGATALAALFGRLQLSLRELEASTWWASNGRDVLVLFSLVVQALALMGLGFPLAAASVMAAQLTLAMVIVEAILLRVPDAPFHDTIAIATAVVAVLPVAAAPRSAFELMELVVRRFA